MFKRRDQIIEDFQQILSWPNSPLKPDMLEKAEEFFYDYLDTIFDFEDWDDFSELYIQFQNFFPALVGKDVGSGSWIKIPTDTGYNVYWAKHSNKVLNSEDLMRKSKRIVSRSKTKEGSTSDEIGKSLDKLNKSEELNNLAKVGIMANLMPSNLKFVKYLRTRTQWEYILPHQYELVSDIQLYMDAVQDRMNQNAVKYKQLFTKQDEDQIFYLQSRGIPRETAVMMCKLQQCYFTVDTKALFSEVYQKK
jgi:hypothetical protein